RAAAQLAQRGVADAEPALPRLAGQEGDRDRDLARGRRAQARGDRIALGETAAGAAHLRGGVDDGGELGHCRSGWTMSIKRPPSLQYPRNGVRFPVEIPPMTCPPQLLPPIPIGDVC